MKNVITRVSALAIIAIASLLTPGCARLPATATTPTSSPNAGLINTLTDIQDGCELAALIPGYGTLIATACPKVVTGIIDVIEANGTAAEIKAGIAGFQATIATVPSAASDSTIQKIITALQGVLNIYTQATGQPTAAISHPGAIEYQAFFASSGSRKLKLTASEKARLKAIRARADKLKKAHPAKQSALDSLGNALGEAIFDK